VRKFRYLLDPLCLLACGLYVLNRFLFREAWPTPFFLNHFNDLLLIPSALPPVLWVQRRCGVRKTDIAPQWGEIFLYLIIWSLVAEVIGPQLFPWVTGDWRDVVAYAVGGFVAGLWWNVLGDHHAQRPAFDRLAPYYDGMEDVLAGRKLERCRRALLPHLPPLTHILLAGEGHGRFLASFLEAQPTARVTCVDSSGRMLAMARKRLRRKGYAEDRVQFVEADLFGWAGDGEKYDLIVTQFVFDCYPESEVERLAQHLASLAQDRALWLVTDFQVPTSGFARWRAWLIHRAMYLFFRVFANLPASHAVSPAPYLQRAGFARQRREEFEWRLLYAELWERGVAKSEAA
jgi:ubiquinone/menaquinone biosynthesis C-methylase UbiE